MTNDDRNDQDRTGDGQAPNWGAAPQQPAAGSTPADDAPRYGERTGDTPQYGQPQYGQPDDGQPQYGSTEYGSTQHGSTRYGEQQGQYGQPQYGQPEHGHGHDQHAPTWGEQQHAQQPYAASAAPTSSGAPSWQGYEEPKRKKKTLGVVAFVLGLAALVLGVVGGYVMGTALGNSSALDDIVQSGGTVDQDEATRQLMNDPAVVSQIAGGAVVAGIAAILGLWALVQGIIAAVTKRGRGWGVFAIVLAVVATIATFVTYIGVAAATASGAGS